MITFHLYFIELIEILFKVVGESEEIMKNWKCIRFFGGGVALMLSINVNAQGVNGTFESSAEIQTMCSISAEDINFGVVSSPLSTQGANASMYVLCNKNTPYSVDLSYGQSVASGDNSGYTLKVHSTEGLLNRYNIYLNGERVTQNNFDLACMGNYNYSGAYFADLNVAGIFGSSIVGRYIGTTEICDSVNGVVKSDWSAFVVGGNKMNGNMKGASKGDLLAYKVLIPDDNSKVWSKGINTYSSVGSGQTQTIRMNAQIIPDNSSSSYVAQDSYFDTITAEVNY